MRIGIMEYMIKAQINDKELVEHIESLPKDEMAVFVMADGRVRGALFHGTRFVNQMRAQHNLGILETMILGQASLCGALLIPTMKGKEHMGWRYEVDGPAAGFSVEADSSGYVRGYLFNEHIPVEKPLENWNLAPFLGNGTMTMTTAREGDKVPSSSSVEILYKNITKDLAWYKRLYGHKRPCCWCRRNVPSGFARNRRNKKERLFFCKRSRHERRCASY